MLLDRLKALLQPIDLLYGHLEFVGRASLEQQDEGEGGGGGLGKFTSQGCPADQERIGDRQGAAVTIEEKGGGLRWQ